METRKLVELIEGRGGELYVSESDTAFRDAARPAVKAGFVTATASNATRSWTLRLTAAGRALLPKPDPDALREELVALEQQREQALAHGEQMLANGLTGDIRALAEKIERLAPQPSGREVSSENLAVMEWIERGGYDDDDYAMLDAIRKQHCA